MPPRRGTRREGGRRGRGAEHTKPVEHPAVQAANPTTFVTQADLAAMEEISGHVEGRASTSSCCSVDPDRPCSDPSPDPSDTSDRALDLSLHERADPFKAADRRSTLGQKRKELAAAGGTLRELPVCRSCRRVHKGHCLVGSGVCFRCKQLEHTADVCPQKCIGTTPPSLPLPNREGFLPLLVRRLSELVPW
ncbi:gag-protease polyprotein [Cucumis melo var. makuwa]|uniref:Gag-protease polyprotein n=1 Tax=Cucumis melo var. makuwa TaxID=1194695 RepID=A0A5D3BIY2_CUCMM|nr:gag-protease polyprotein [Cucumis melo var. makuwa]